MFRINKSKSAMAVVTLLILATLTPTAYAAKPGSPLYLDRAWCKSLAPDASWLPGKNPACLISGTVILTENRTLKAGVSLYINGSSSSFTIPSGVTLINYGYIHNSGTTINDGYIYNYSPGHIANYGAFTNNSDIQNFSLIVNHSRSFANNGYIANNGAITNNPDALITNTGVIENQGALGNAGTITNICPAYRWIGGDPNPLGDFIKPLCL
jgi:hypothetical protein